MTGSDTASSGEAAGGVAIVGGGPAGLVAAIALARRGIPSTVFDIGVHPEVAPRFNPARSYPIDITGHGLRALLHIEATSSFDARLLRFKGIQYQGQVVDEWTEPGWTGSRGDILRALMAVADTHKEHLNVEYECRVTSVEVDTGELTYTSSGSSGSRRFDLVIGADGAGSLARHALQTQLAGFTVDATMLPNYLTMIELDRLSDQLDKNYLQALAVRPFCVAGAVKGDNGSEDPRWFCAIGTRKSLAFSSVDAARTYLRRKCPRILDLASPAAVAAFADRTCYHIGQKLTCSRLHGGRVVLVGDAAAPFPPIGQGVNAAMESAIVLDQCIGATGGSPFQLAVAAADYNAAWKPEADAVSWISERMLFENRLHTLRARVTSKLGVNVIAQSKRSDLSYTQVRRRAEQLGPLWR